MQDVLAPMMSERFALARWLVDNELIDGGWMSADGPPLASELAAPVRELGAHTSEGISQLGRLSNAELEEMPALASLPAQRRALLLGVLRKKIAELKATEHDEL